MPIEGYYVEQRGDRWVAIIPCDVVGQTAELVVDLRLVPHFRGLSDRVAGLFERVPPPQDKVLAIANLTR